MHGKSTKPARSKGNKFSGDSLDFNVKGGGNALGGGVLKVKSFPGGSKPKGFESTPIPTSEQ
jgi:hypothetical protein